MGIAKSVERSKDAAVVEVDHWIYGVVEGVGYTTKAASRGLSVSLYETHLRGHYTPIRPALVQSESPVDLQMIHPVGSGEDFLLSRISRGHPDEAGRPTFRNHTAVAPAEVLRSGRITLEAVYRALGEFDQKAADLSGEMDPLKVPSRSGDAGGLFFGPGIHRYLTFPALETLATRMMADPRSRTLLLCRDSTPDTRNKTLCLVVELLNWACGLPPFSAISDAPTASAMNFFRLVVAPRGVRADASWALLESAAIAPALPRISGQDRVYEALAEAFRHPKAPRSAR